MSETTKCLLEKYYPNLYTFAKNKDVEIKALGTTMEGFLVNYIDQNDDFE